MFWIQSISKNLEAFPVHSVDKGQNPNPTPSNQDRESDNFLKLILEWLFASDNVFT